MKKILSISLLAATLFTSCTKDNDAATAEFEGKTTISFDAKAGASDFALNTDFTIGSRVYNFSRLRYWISNVKLVDTKGNEYAVPNSYFLIEETGSITLSDLSDPITYPARKREDVNLTNIPVGDYKTIKFSIGVDSRYNDNLSLQAGELSQYSGMTNVSWMWLTSYIFTNLEGTVKEGATTKNFKAETGLNANYKSVSLDLPAPVRISTANTQSKIALTVDITKILNGIDLITTPTVGAGQASVMTALANNYSNAFSISSAK